MLHRRTRWLTPWAMWQTRRRKAALAASREREERERRAAVRRLLQQATTMLPTVSPRPASSAPLLTRGQAARSRRA